MKRQTRVLAYLRVSTERQYVENQELVIQEYCKTHGLEVDETIGIEVSSRKATKERRIDETVEKLRKGDTLLVSELSRIGRSLSEVVEIVDQLIKRGVRFVAIKQGIDINGKHDIASKTMIAMFGLMAEIERDLISERTKQGLAVAKARGVRLGNPNLKNMNTTNMEQAEKYAESLRPTLVGYIAQGYSQRKIVDELNSVGVRARRGGTWSLLQLQKVLNRLGLKTQRASALGSN